MKYVEHCKDPLFFMKIYNCLSDSKRLEFEKKYEEYLDTFKKTYGNKLFNPQIIFQDSQIIITEENLKNIVKIDLRDELNDKIIISEELLEDILDEFNKSHGLYVINSLKEKDIQYKLDFNNICFEIEEILK